MSSSAIDLESQSGAILSDDGVYRYALWRRWDDAPPLTFVMLNPSTADAAVDDPTIRRCVGFARRESAGGVVVVNLFAFRATDPTDLAVARLRGVDVAGPENHYWLSTFVAVAAGVELRRPIVAAWGAHQIARDRGAMLAEQFAGALSCLGVTKDGAPRHPLYVRAGAELVGWPR